MKKAALVAEAARLRAVGRRQAREASGFVALEAKPGQRLRVRPQPRNRTRA